MGLLSCTVVRLNEIDRAGIYELSFLGVEGKVIVVVVVLVSALSAVKVALGYCLISCRVFVGIVEIVLVLMEGEQEVGEVALVDSKVVKVGTSPVSHAPSPLPPLLPPLSI
jgi:hypothetical protein